ncbi:thiamin biosynthesis lipoprotein ApbE [Halorhodospira halochloris]|uniref:FAD:protein FMN transferase n=1 Tax=Halorhodospira halochloris TaxID=1052 RepID=A0A110B4S6_HALHR|nr:FAD:protein FMN transferase [Halorhodospira halochloris]MBK1651074.1 hypothetical protein [Halorhodospira halochloris]BAU56412.1 thiamin biosynthesis lipoprotein ApbE [Halorhodospira halochloris]
MINRTPPKRSPYTPALTLITGLAILSGLVLLNSCERPQEAESLSFSSLGTVVEIKITDPGAADQQQALQAARAQIDQIHGAWHPTFGSELGPLNENLAKGESTKVSAELIELLNRAREVEQASSGKFSPAIGGLTELWAFSSHDGPLKEPPDRDKLLEWVEKSPRLSDLVITEDREVSTKNTAVQLDLGAIGKGYAAQQAINALTEAGVKSAVVNIGGDLVTRGHPEMESTRNWRIGVKDPRSEDILATVEAAADEAIFTSGDYERAYEHEDSLYHHILDPTTGYPAMGSRSVTVIDTDPVWADAAATALFIAGPEGWQDLAERLGIEHVLLIDSDGKAWMSSSMEQRVEMHRDIETNRVDDLAE